MPTAVRGRSAFVEIEVATAFAVSWNPFVKSKASAVATTRTRRRSASKLVVSAAGRYPFLITMPSRMCAAVSVASTARSSAAKTSFQRITTIGSIPFANSEASASR